MPTALSRIHEAPDDLLAAIDYCYEQGWTDGLPVVPPVVDRVKAMLAADSRPPETVIAHHPATGLDLSLHAAAVNAVMAGCLPRVFPGAGRRLRGDGPAGRSTSTARPPAPAARRRCWS